ncbi:MAG: aminodeoxychorismate/anthranilate synthase component II [Oscillospiraceae bacterium]|nr:aminodeoxychorismate/anthranilate synthase component II [Oscillospiraceae bacterium]
MILIIDNYDSFTYNLYQLVGQLRSDVTVTYNDQITCDDIAAMQPSHIILSPGPGRPADAGVCKDVVARFAGEIPLLGICLGHQAICEVYGATVGYAKTLMHGKACGLHIANGNPIFRGLPPLLQAGRYHSLAAERGTLPDDLLVIAETDDGEVMGVKHRSHALFGLQFHPESILTPQGSKIIENFLHIGGNV